MGCINGGKYKQYKDNLVYKSIETRKCRCPFKLKGKFVTKVGWKHFVICGVHNHKVSETLLGHAYVSHLNSEEKTMLSQMTKNMLKSGQIFLIVKDQD